MNTPTRRKCTNCQDDFECQKSSQKKFCSQSCSAKYNNSKRVLSEKTKAKIGKSIKNKISNGEMEVPKRTILWVNKICPLCGKEYKIKPWQDRLKKGKYCSEICARKRPGQGGYRSGSVTNYKSGWYISPFAGKVWLDSSYEFIVAEHLDDKKYKWRKNYQGFPYIDKDGKQRAYIPDFYISDIDLWVESKGYFTENDKCKMRDFLYKITLISKDKIYDKSKWGF